jgi:hypothetical protein
MQTDEIVKLTRQAVHHVLALRSGEEPGFEGSERRRNQRWPFPGTAELRLVDDPAETQWFATCRDLSETGMGLSCDRYFEPGTPVEISIHLPEATLYGAATIRYCAHTPRGFMTGVEFAFDVE